MSDEQRVEDAEERAQGSVFGNLPGSRPGRRSPRRATGGPDTATPSRAEQKAEGPSSKPKPREAKPKPPRAAPKPQPKAERAPGERAPTSEGPEETPDRGGGLEDLAWAGVAAAAEAATLGVRIANRAFESLRDAVDRR